MAGLAASFGSGAMTNSIREIDDADVMFVIGSNTTEAHPVISYFMKRAVKRGARLIVSDPRRIDLTRWATTYVQHKVGTDVAYLNGLMNIIVRNGWHDEEFIRQRCENWDEMKKLIDRYPPQKASEICGVPVEEMERVARILGEADHVALFYTLGITEHTSGTDNVKSCANLQMILGQLGRPSAGVNPLRGQNNVQGACDMGALPNVYQGYQKVDDPEARKGFEAGWKVTNLPAKQGLRIPEMLSAMAAGSMKGFICYGENLVMTEPNMAHTVKCLKALEFLVVADIFPNETTKYADVVLPCTSWAEEEGTYTNTERRVQRVRPFLRPEGQYREFWWIANELARRLGHGLGFTDSRSVWEDMRALAPSMAGVTWERCDKVGLQWPCPSSDHPGTRFLHKDRFARGKGLFHPCEWRPPAEVADAKWPLVLSTGRRLWQYHTTQTRRAAGIDGIFGEELIELSPPDAAERGVKGGDWVRVSSRRGSIECRAWVTDRSPRGVAWCSFHFREACGNVLTNDAFDPVTLTAEYKACAIQIEKLRDGEPLGLPLERQARP